MPRCPTCKRDFTPHADTPLPFCGKRCKLVDLDNWLGGRYVVSEGLPFSEGDDGALAEPPHSHRGEHDE